MQQYLKPFWCAHIDHSGYLPLLVKRGFHGPVYCTPATEDFCRILLPDSGYLQEEEANYANRHGFSQHSPALPLYTRRDAEACLYALNPIEYRKEVDLGNGLTFRLLPAGHILGAAMVSMRHGATSLLFSGDLGRPDDRVIKPPASVDHADFLIVESTYGDRRHDPTDPKVKLGEVINRTLHRGGMSSSQPLPSAALSSSCTTFICSNRTRSSRIFPSSSTARWRRTSRDCSTNTRASTV